MIHEIDLKDNSYNFSQTIYGLREVTGDREVNAHELSLRERFSFPRLRFIFRARIKRRAFDGLVNFHDGRSRWNGRRLRPA